MRDGPFPSPTLATADPARPLVRVVDLAVDFGSHPALRDVDLEIRNGEIVTLVGPNGSGKSTLLRAIVGALRPRSGRVERAPGLSIGYVPQRLHLDPTMPMTVSRFLRLPRRPSRDGVDAALEQVGLRDVASRQMTALSGGQFQRVLLARAILAAPDLLILDEATQGLDQPATAAFYQLLAGLRDRLDCAVLMVSHDLHVVMSASDRVICLNGHVCCAGTPETVSAARAYRDLFGEGTGGTFALYRHHHDHAHGAVPAPRDDA